MGVYIPNMEMPHDENDSIHILRDGTAVVYRTGSIDFYKAISVPPHGRLIEAEPIMKFIQDGLNSGEFGYDQIKVLTEIQYAPTIIPAESITAEEEKNDKQGSV